MGYGVYGDERLTRGDWSPVKELDDGCWEWRGTPRATKPKPQHKKYVEAFHAGALDYDCKRWQSICPNHRGYSCMNPDHWEPFPKWIRDELADEEMPEELREAQRRDVEALMNEPVYPPWNPSYGTWRK